MEFSNSQIQFLWKVSLLIWNSQILKYNFYGKSASKSGLLKFSNTISMERLPQNPEFSNTISMESQPQNLEFSNSQIQFLCKVSLNIRNSHILKYNIYGKSASKCRILIFSNKISFANQPHNSFSDLFSVHQKTFDLFKCDFCSPLKRRGGGIYCFCCRSH